MNKIALDVIDAYYTAGFWESTITENNKYKISRKKLSEEQYKATRKKLKQLNKNG